MATPLEIQLIALQSCFSSTWGTNVSINLPRREPIKYRSQLKGIQHRILPLTSKLKLFEVAYFSVLIEDRKREICRWQ